MPSSPNSRSGCTPRAGRRVEPAGAAGAPGHGHVRQGRRAAAHRRAGRPAGGADHVVQEADGRGARARLPVADPPGRCPSPGYLGVFDRSHYEDVLIARVEGLAEPDEIEQRYDEINDVRARAHRGRHGRHQVPAAHLAAEQRERLLARLDDPTKHWKYNPGDLDARARWADYRAAYEIALERTNTEHAPWHVVPSDKKWYRNLGRRPAAARRAARHGPVLAGRGLRRGRRTGQAARGGRDRLTRSGAASSGSQDE